MKIFEYLLITLSFLLFFSLMEAKDKFYSDSVRFIFKVNPKISPLDVIEITNSIKLYSIRTGLSKIDFLSICGWESGFKKHIVGRKDKNDKGICQINYNTWKWYKKKGWIEGEWKDIHNITYNIHVASVILMRHRYHLGRSFPNKTTKELDKLLIESYNKGVRGVKRIIKNGGKLMYYNLVIKFKGDLK